MFSQYEPVAGRERRRKTRGEKIKQRMLRSSYDENTRSYTTLRASNSCAANWLERRSARSLSLSHSLLWRSRHEQSKTPWRARDWKKRTRQSAAATRAARERAAEDAALTDWGQPVESRMVPGPDHTAVLTPWDGGDSARRYRAVAKCTVRAGPELDSEPAGSLSVGQEITVQEGRMIGQRYNITRFRFEGGWVSERGKKGKRLLRRLDWPVVSPTAETRDVCRLAVFSRRWLIPAVLRSRRSGQRRPSHATVRPNNPRPLDIISRTRIA